jgi:uncharacterized protein (TIGR02118 family)
LTVAAERRTMARGTQAREERGPMIKSVVFFKRRAGMPVDEFQSYWRSRHAEIVAGLPGVRRYVQSHTRPSIYARREPAYDGIAELWNDDVDALRAMVRHPHYAVVKEDEGRFIDGATMAGLVTREHVIVDGPAPSGAVKNVEFVTRRPDLSVERFQRHWREVHGPIAAAIPVLRRYVQSHALPEAYGRRSPPYDGIAVTWFDSVDAMRHSATTPEYARTREDEPNFIAAGDVPVILTTEHVVVG